jgi:hypothetical protein
MEVYGKEGYVFCLDKENMLLMENNQRQKDTLKATPLPDAGRDPFIYFTNVVNGKIRMNTYDLSAPANNRIVMQILEAAKYAAKHKITVIWSQFYKQ